MFQVAASPVVFALGKTIVSFMLQQLQQLAEQMEQEVGSEGTRTNA